ncbi:MAG: glutamate synthase subunit beta [Cyclobacteriaceae bacterium]|nr:glutamate synthase subunit beta [Cyclobacteriaceae bacterium]MCH8517234.1 glutamate synthase subunit beta [Cyclobacteriaceae bacterium]
MGAKEGFLKYNRELPPKRAPKLRINDFKEIYEPFSEEKLVTQAARCMDCGVPFCHSGCPLGNNIPEFNDAVYNKDWKLAYDILDSTNNFPEFTGRICPAPCESSCVLGINKPPVTIENIEKNIIEEAFKRDIVQVRKPEKRLSQKVAVIGSGPSGLAAADQLNKAGYQVTVYEKNSQAGGLLRYGIPDFKLEKWVVERRINLMEQEGVSFVYNTNIGKDISGAKIMEEFDAVVLACGAEKPRDLPIDGRDAKGVHFAMDFLTLQNRKVSNEWTESFDISAAGKDVIVIGGGDTGADCVGTSNRQGAESVTQIELLERPPEERSEDNPWPQWPMILRTSTSHEEGCDRKWALMTKAFVKDDEGNLCGVKTVEVEWKKDKNGKMGIKEIPNTEKVLPCQLALLAIGFEHTIYEGLVEELALARDDRGNVKASEVQYQTNIKKVFAAGDMRRGQSLVVWAIAEGREAAAQVDTYLSSESFLEKRDESFYATKAI